MRLLEKLKALGCQLKLVQLVPGAGTEPKKISTRNVTLQELTTELHNENMRILAESPVELTISFEKVFHSAGISNLPNGWTAQQLAALLRSKPYSDMDRTTLQQAVVKKLTAEKITAEALIKDAVAKDQALDAFEIFVEKKIKSRSSARQMRLLEIEKEIASLQQEQMRLTQEDKSEVEQLSGWKQNKENYEKDIQAAVDFLLSCKDLVMD